MTDSSQAGTDKTCLERPWEILVCGHSAKRASTQNSSLSIRLVWSWSPASQRSRSSKINQVWCDTRSWFPDEFWFKGLCGVMSKEWERPCKISFPNHKHPSLLRGRWLPLQDGVICWIYQGCPTKVWLICPSKQSHAMVENVTSNHRGVPPRRRCSARRSVHIDRDTVWNLHWLATSAHNRCDSHAPGCFLSSSHFRDAKEQLGTVRGKSHWKSSRWFLPFFVSYRSIAVGCELSLHPEMRTYKYDVRHYCMGF